MMLPAVGASTCASGSHVWKGNIGTFIAKAIKKRTNLLHQKRYIKGAAAFKIKGYYADKEKDRPGHGIEEEFQGRVNPVRASPNAYYKIHGDEHGLPEYIKEEAIQRSKYPEHRALYKKKRYHELLYLFLYRPP